MDDADVRHHTKIKKKECTMMTGALPVGEENCENVRVKKIFLLYSDSQIYTYSSRNLVFT